MSCVVFIHQGVVSRADRHGAIILYSVHRRGTTTQAWTLTATEALPMPTCLPQIFRRCSGGYTWVLTGPRGAFRWPVARSAQEYTQAFPSHKYSSSILAVLHDEKKTKKFEIVMNDFQTYKTNNP